MNSNSSVVTGSVTITAATLIPVITWGLGGFKADDMPETVPYLIAAALVTVAHLAANIFNNWAKREVADVSNKEFAESAMKPTRPAPPTPTTEEVKP